MRRKGFRRSLATGRRSRSRRRPNRLTSRRRLARGSGRCLACGFRLAQLRGRRRLRGLRSLRDFRLFRGRLAPGLRPRACRRRRRGRRLRCRTNRGRQRIRRTDDRSRRRSRRAHNRRRRAAKTGSRRSRPCQRLRALRRARRRNTRILRRRKSGFRHGFSPHRSRLPRLRINRAARKCDTAFLPGQLPAGRERCSPRATHQKRPFSCIFPYADGLSGTKHDHGLGALHKKSIYHGESGASRVFCTATKGISLGQDGSNSL